MAGTGGGKTVGREACAKKIQGVAFLRQLSKPNINQIQNTKQNTKKLEDLLEDPTGVLQSHYNTPPRLMAHKYQHR